jgi:hypothetical protein
MNYELIIERDQYSQNPRNCNWQENATKMICFHSKYELGDKHHYRKEDYNSWEELKKAILKNENVGIIRPLYLYEHSGITISTRPFSCEWDSGQVGFVYMTKEAIIDCGKPDERIDSEVKEYDCYLRGDVYQYSIFEITENDKTCVSNVSYFYDENDCRECGEEELNDLRKASV